MFYSFYSIFWLVLGLLFGALFFMAINGWFRPRQNKKVRIEDQTQNAKIIATLVGLFAVSVISWFVKYLSGHDGWNPLIGDIASASFGVSTAGLLGGVIFELFLRKDILSQTSEVLADIVMTDKDIIEEVFTKEKRNKIIEILLQLNTSNDVKGSALYHDFIAHYADDHIGYQKEFRFDFEDSITLFDIDPDKSPELSSGYYQVNDKIRFRTYRNEYTSRKEFVFGCAPSETKLYSFFSDPNCIYRWLLKDENFNKIIEEYRDTFCPKLYVNGEECISLGEGEITTRGYEVRFLNPLNNKVNNIETSHDNEFVELELEILTLHPKYEPGISVHLAYPVKGADINLDFEHVDKISNVTTFYFIIAGKNKPRVEKGVKSSLGKNGSQRIRKVKITNEHWLFPDSGVVFILE